MCVYNVFAGVPGEANSFSPSYFVLMTLVSLISWKNFLSDISLLHLIPCGSLLTLERVRGCE